MHWISRLLQTCCNLTKRKNNQQCSYINQLVMLWPKTLRSVSRLKWCKTIVGAWPECVNNNFKPHFKHFCGSTRTWTSNLSLCSPALCHCSIHFIVSFPGQHQLQLHVHCDSYHKQFITSNAVRCGKGLTIWTTCIKKTRILVNV